MLAPGSVSTHATGGLGYGRFRVRWWQASTSASEDPTRKAVYQQHRHSPVALDHFDARHLPGIGGESCNPCEEAVTALGWRRE